MTFHPGGPEDIIDSRDKFDPLFGDAAESEFTTALHRQDLWAAHLSVADPTPEVPWRARGEAPAPSPGVKSHRRQPESWWQRVDWFVVVLVPAIAGMAGFACYIGWVAWTRNPGMAPLLAASQDQVDSLQLQLWLLAALTFFTSLMAILALWVRR